MGLLNVVYWRISGLCWAKKFDEQIRAELLSFVALLPLAVMDLRSEFSSLVTCSDAFPDGAGVCISGACSRREG